MAADGDTCESMKRVTTVDKAPAHLADAIVIVRGQRVLLDRVLASLYGVETRRLNEQVRRNRGRFPEDFVFELTADEARRLMSQNATSKRGGTRKPPIAFTEHGAIMAATVLNSRRAVEMSVFVVRAFVQFRTALASSRELARRLDELEKLVVTKFTQNDRALSDLMKAIRALMEPPPVRKRPIGFTADL